MLESRVVLDGPAARVYRVRCPGHERRFGAPEPVSRAAIVLPCSGVFRLRVDGRERVIDATTAYVQLPGDEQQFAHPAGGDVCTSIEVDPESAGDRLAAVANRPAPVTPRLALAHRLLLRRARAGADPVELTDLTESLIGEVLAMLDADPPAGSAGEHRLVESARELLTREPALALPELAAQVGTSPWRLSRLFHRLTGVTLHRYRTRLRVGVALDRLAEGADSLAALAGELGFADQAHLTRVMKDNTGLPPGRLRAMLSPWTAQ